MEMNVFIIFAVLNQFKASDKRKIDGVCAGLQHYDSNDPQTSESAPKKSKSEDTVIVKHSKQPSTQDTTQDAFNITGTSFKSNKSKSGTQTASNARTLVDVPKQESETSQQSNPKQNDSRDTLIASDCAGPVDDGWAYLPILSFSAYRSSMASRLCPDPKESTNTLNSNDTPKPSPVCKQQDYTKRIYFRFDLNETDESLEIIVVNRGGKFVDDNDGDCCFLHLDYLDKPDLQMFVGNTDGRDLSYRCVIESYISFIANRCLQYNDKLKCFVLKKELWGIHAYMSEFYCLIMWKLEALKDEAKLEEETRREFEEFEKLEDGETALSNIIKQKKEMYKAHLIREIKFFDQFIDAYSIIEKTDVDIYDLITKIGIIRKETKKYFDIFHSKQIISLLYNETYAYNDYDSARTQTIENPGQVKPLTTNLPPSVDGSPDSVGEETDDQKQQDRIYWLSTTFKSKQNSIYIFLFTSDFDKFDSRNLNINLRNKNSNHYQFLRSNFGLRANTERLQIVYMQVLDFIFFVQDNANLPAEDQTNAELDHTKQDARRAAIDFASEYTNNNQIIDRISEFCQQIRDAILN